MYVSAWVKFLSLVYNARLEGASPGILDPWVAKYANDLRNGRRDLAADLRLLGDGCRTPGTARGYRSAVRTLLAEADLPLTPKGARELRRASGHPRPAPPHEPLTPEKILRLLEHLDTRGRAILYVLSSSGARLGEVLSLRPGDLDLGSRPARFQIRDARGGVVRVAFLSREAVAALRVYLMVKDRFATTARSRGGTRDPDLLFPFGCRSFEQVWALALSKAGLERSDPVTGRRTLPPRSTRRFFHDRMRTLVSEALVGELMGGSGPCRREHPLFTEEELAGAYLRGEPAVTLHRSRREEGVTRKIARLERLVARLADEAAEREREMARMREILSTEGPGGRGGPGEKRGPASAQPNPSGSPSPLGIPP